MTGVGTTAPDSAVAKTGDDHVSAIGEGGMGFVEERLIPTAELRLEGSRA
ncbi:hypothetical protein G6038_29330 [Rhodococcus sp. 14C212]|nr:hypothetical protein [Rhodococcus sp. 14C212]NGP09495.1 hypothetical protein [Rhodococcus sp. 14C212]